LLIHDQLICCLLF